MDRTTAIPQPPVVSGVNWGILLTLGTVTLVALGFVLGFALPYFTLDRQQFGPYWPRRGWLLLHIGGGMVALLAGPGQLWLGLTQRFLWLHRRLGVVYTAGVALSAVSALYLACNTDFGWVFGTGLAGLAITWIVTTGLAIVAIRRRLLEQHQEWMIRSYVVTCAFVTFRILVTILQAVGVGTQLEQFAAASWFCWAVPLLITEVVLQGRKILGASPTASPAATTEGGVAARS